MMWILFALILLALPGLSEADCPLFCSCINSTDPATSLNSFSVSCVGLLEVPDWPEDIQPISQLFISNMDIDKLDRHSFASLDHIRTLSIRFSKIKRIDYRAFDNLNGDRNGVLMLAYNEIKSIGDQAFYQIKNFASIQILGGSIELVETGAFTSVSTGSFIVSDATIGKIETEAFFYSLTFNQDFSLPSSIGAFPDELVNRLDDVDRYGISGCDARSVINAKATFFSMVSNTVGTIATRAFDGVAAPSLMSVHNNKIGLIEGNMFGDEGGAVTVSLSSNVVEGLAKKAFGELKTTQKFMMFGNLFNCSAVDTVTDGVHSTVVLEEDNAIVMGSEESENANCIAALKDDNGAASAVYATNVLVAALLLAILFIS